MCFNIVIWSALYEYQNNFIFVTLAVAKYIFNDTQKVPQLLLLSTAGKLANNIYFEFGPTLPF
jgi:hypothetical protein